MNDDELQERAREFDLKPGYQLQLRHALYTSHLLKQLSKEARKDEITRFANESNFLLRRTVDHGFYRFVKKMELKRKDWYWNQVEELGYLVLLDVLHPEKAIPARSGNSQFRRIRRNFPEMFFTPPRIREKKKLDKRETRFSTIFSDMTEVDKSDWADAIKLLAVQDLARLPHVSKVHEMRAFHAALRMVDPNDVIGLQKFWELQKSALKIITSKFGHATHEEWLIPHVERATIVLDGIYQLIDDAVALRWYRTIKSDAKKVKLLREKHPLFYSREDAKAAVEHNFEFCRDSVRAVDIILRGADAYAQLGRYSVAQWLYEECLKQPLEKEDRGLCLHNMAWLYFLTRRPRRYLHWLRKALETFEEMNSPFDIGITWAFIAEAHYILGNSHRYSEAMQRSKDILSRSNLSDYKLALASLYVADCAMRIKNRAWEREAVVSGLKAASKLEDPEYFLYFNQRLSDLDAGKSTPLAEMEPSKLKRPPLFRWHVEGSEHFIPLSPQTSLEKENEEA